MIATRPGGGAVLEYTPDAFFVGGTGLAARQHVQVCSASALSPLPTECTTPAQPIPQWAIADPSLPRRITPDRVAVGGMWTLFAAPAGGATVLGLSDG